MNFFIVYQWHPPGLPLSNLKPNPNELTKRFISILLMTWFIKGENFKSEEHLHSGCFYDNLQQFLKWYFQKIKSCIDS